MYIISCSKVFQLVTERKVMLCSNRQRWKCCFFKFSISHVTVNKFFLRSREFKKCEKEDTEQKEIDDGWMMEEDGRLRTVMMNNDDKDKSNNSTVDYNEIKMFRKVVYYKVWRLSKSWKNDALISTSLFSLKSLKKKCKIFL